MSAWRRTPRRRPARDDYLEHQYRCRAGCQRAARIYCPEGARLREAYERYLERATAETETHEAAA